MTKDKKEDLPESLLSTIRGNGIDNILNEGTELLIDELLTEGVLKDIPIVNFIRSLFKAGYSVRDHLFLKKVIGFVEPLSKYTPEERKEFLNKLDEKELKKASGSIVLYLERLDAIEKSKMLGRIFEAYMLGEIKYKPTMYFIHFVDAVFILVWEDFHSSIIECENSSFFSPTIHLDDALALEKVGFYEEHIKAEHDGIRLKEFSLSSNRILKLSEAGWEFIQIVFGVGNRKNDKFHRSSFDVEVQFRG